METVDVAVVGGGQAGLATSRELTDRGVEYVVLERGRIGQTLRDRWDTFCLVTPNWTVQLPGHPYDGDAPDGFMPRDDIVAYLERYATHTGSPVREGVGVSGVGRGDAAFTLTTSAGDLRARSVVPASGAHRRPIRPAGADGFPRDLQRMDVTGYSNPDAVAPGKVLIIGSGQSGCQLAEELHEAGREVFLAAGRTPWVTRRIGGRDILYWLVASWARTPRSWPRRSPSLRILAPASRC